MNHAERPLLVMKLAVTVAIITMVTAPVIVLGLYKGGHPDALDFLKVSIPKSILPK